MGSAAEILINGRFLDQATTGVQRYGRGIANALDRLISDRHPAASDLAITLVRPKSSASKFPYRYLSELRAGSLRGHAWEQLELPFYAKTAPLLNLCNTSPLLGRNNLVVVHDANVWLAPENYSRSFRTAYQILLPAGIRKSRKWVTVSRFSAHELITRQIADRPPDAIIGNGCDHMLDLDADRSSIATHRPKKPFVFAIGSRSRAKNIDLVRSLAPALQRKDITVAIAGDANAAVFGASGNLADQGALDLGRVSDEDLAFLMKNCLCFLFPSIIEGFGIPPLEAMAMGAPVVSSNTASMPEVLEDAALYCAPGDPAAWIATVERLAGDDQLRAELAAKGRTQSAKYTWRSSAIRLIELARKLLPNS
jgi:glycosyltransferase involved in cell wall biosynthesis